MRLALLGVLWGANFLFMKVAAAAVSPPHIVLLRLGCGAAVLWVALACAGGPIPRGRSLWSNLTVMGALAAIAPFLLLAIGTARLGAGLAGTLSGSIALMTAALSALLLPDESIGRRGVVGLVLGFAGVAVVSAPWRGASIDLVGVLAIVGGSLAYAASFVFARRSVAPRAMPPLALATGQLTAATIVMLVLALCFTGPPAPVTLSAGLAVVALGALGTGAATILYYGLVRDLGATRASTVTYLPPPVAILLGTAVLGEPLRDGIVLGGCLILVGIALTRREAHRASSS